MAHNFGKISAPFGRANPKDRLVNLEIPAKKWVPFFMDIKMYASEKIDGTSVGIVWDGERISFVGHTDKSEFCPRYLEYLKANFGTSEFESVIEEIFSDKPAKIFGEGISKDYNVDYGFPEGNFIMYDVMGENGTYYNRDAVKEIAKKLGLIYPHEEMMTIREAIDFVKNRPQSFLNSKEKLEGLVLRSPIELYTNSLDRVICKVKVKDFVDGVKDYRSE